MKLHTNLNEAQVRAVLIRTKDKGLITQDVHFTVFTPGRSQSHAHGYEIQLGTDNQDSLPAGYKDQNGKNMRVRRVRNAMNGEARYAATWHEWGWLIAEMFEADPESRWGDNPARSAHPWGYFSAQDFNRKTGDQFLPVAG